MAQKHGAKFPKSEINTVKFNLPSENKKPEKRYLLTLDIEATCVEKGKIEPCAEIIEISLGIVDSHEHKIVDIFHQYVLPQKNPELSEYCTKYTNVSQEKVNQAQHV